MKNIKLKKVTHFSVFNHLINKGQYVTQLYETGELDEETTDILASVLMYCVFSMCGRTFICELVNPVFFIYAIP
jgi:hypothetical protein